MKISWIAALSLLLVAASGELWGQVAGRRPATEPQGVPGQANQKIAGGRTGSTTGGQPGTAGAAGQQHTVNRPVAGGMMQSTDQQIAAWLTVCNEGEIRMGQFASKRAKQDSVRKFADQMVKEHSHMNQQLAQFAGQAAGGGRAAERDGSAGAQSPRESGANTGVSARPAGQKAGAGDADADADDAAPSPGDAAGRESSKGAVGGATAAGRPAGGFDWLSVKRQIGQRLLASMERDLGKRQGAEFDPAYIGSQIVMHEEMIATQQVLREHASPDLQKVIDGGIEHAQMHLDSAKQIISQLPSAKTSGGTARGNEKGSGGGETGTGREE